MSDSDPVRHASRTARGAAELDLGEVAIELLRSRLPNVAESTVRAVIVEVPGYTNALAGSMGANIQRAVQLALAGFLNLASSPRSGGDPGTPLAPALEGAYLLGRGEARSGRSMDALLAAYRVGARVSWRELSSTAVEAGLPAGTLAKFAELVFAYIDELSAASVAGHTDELATTGRVRQRYLQRLGRSLLVGDPADQLADRAERADWEPPRTLTAVLLPNAQVRGVLAVLDPRTLRPEDELPELEEESEVAVLLVPDADGPGRVALLRSLRGRQAWVGPSQPWTMARTSYLRVLRARRLRLPVESDAPVDTDRHLAALVVAADPAALEDLRRRVLAPFATLRPATADRLTETLREWLLHLGRRDDVAAAMHVHPQTVRYRMGQIRELFGNRLEDPQTILALTIALTTNP
ncbi:helix-turn-helix domain-containing protein [Kribbella sp. NBC_01245]|uniref:PucR family transcriptional regulator n=1 Tax=Kribbella sp. NBC_01245 TaxID=2903578 RepID=UPI002E295C5A|nr:helix-turn-helix domain-containing protein [Kribbella sp. NBC_01245]